MNSSKHQSVYLLHEQINVSWVIKLIVASTVFLVSLCKARNKRYYYENDLQVVQITLPIGMQEHKNRATKFPQKREPFKVGYQDHSHINWNIKHLKYIYL